MNIVVKQTYNQLIQIKVTTQHPNYSVTIRLTTINS